MRVAPTQAYEVYGRTRFPAPASPFPSPALRLAFGAFLFVLALAASGCAGPRVVYRGERAMPIMSTNGEKAGTFREVVEVVTRNPDAKFIRRLKALSRALQKPLKLGEGKLGEVPLGGDE